MTIDRHIILRFWNGRRNRSAAYAVHCTSEILSDRTAECHPSHHSSRIEPTAIAVCSHFTKCICTRNTNVTLRLDLICCEVRTLCLLALRVLAFFPCNAETLLVILRLSLYTSRSDIFSNFYEFLIVVAVFVNFDRSNVHTRYQNAEIIIESFADDSLQLFTDKPSLSIQLYDRNIFARVYLKTALRCAKC